MDFCQIPILSELRAETMDCGKLTMSRVPGVCPSEMAGVARKVDFP